MSYAELSKYVMYQLYALHPLSLRYLLDWASRSRKSDFESLEGDKTTAILHAKQDYSQLMIERIFAFMVGHYEPQGYP